MCYILVNVFSYVSLDLELVSGIYRAVLVTATVTEHCKLGDGHRVMKSQRLHNVVKSTCSRDLPTLALTAR